MVSKFPAQNDSGQTDFRGVIQELILFGITTHRDFEDLITRHRTQMLDIDSGRVKHQGYMFSALHHLLKGEEEQKHYRESHGANIRPDFDDCLKNRYWHSFVVLVRLAIELEFGAKYMTYLEDKWESQSGEMFEGDWASAPDSPPRKLTRLQ